MRDQIAVDTIRKEVLEGGGMDAAFLLYNQVWLFTLMGVMTLVIELGAPVFLFSRRSSRFWAIATFGMHWGIYFIMGIKFRYQLCGIMFLPFFHVEWTSASFRRLLWRITTIGTSRTSKSNDVVSLRDRENGMTAQLEVTPHGG